VASVAFMDFLCLLLWAIFPVFPYSRMRRKTENL
jgi:hypothetical protein